MPVLRPAFFISLRLPASLSTNKIHPTTPPHNSTIGKLSHCFPPHSPGSNFNIQHPSLNTAHAATLGALPLSWATHQPPRMLR